VIFTDGLQQADWNVMMIMSAALVLTLWRF